MLDVATCRPLEYSSSAVGERCARSRPKDRWKASLMSHFNAADRLVVLKSRSGPMAIGFVDVDLVAVDARAEFGLDRAEAAFAEPEQAGVVATSTAARTLPRRSLRNRAGPIAGRRRRPSRAAAGAPVPDAALGAGVVEHGADFLAFEFGVRVVGVRDLGAQRLEHAQVVEAAAQFVAVLVHGDGDRAFLFVRRLRRLRARRRRRVRARGRARRSGC